MNLKNIFTSLFKNWMQPILFSFVAFPLFILGSFIDVGIIQLVGGILFFTNLVWLFSSFIYLLFSKQWGKALYTLLFITAIVMVFGLLLS